MRSLIARSTLTFALLLPGIVLAQEVVEDATAPAAVEAAVANSDTAITTDAQAEVQSSVATEVAVTGTEEAVASTETAESNGVATNGLVGTPPAGKGQIVFFREKKFAGSAVRYKVREGGTELGKLSSGAYFLQVAEPGVHEYTVHSEAKDVLTLEVDAGETYYVQGTLTMGFLAGRPNLSPSDETTFTGMSKKLKLTK